MNWRGEKEKEGRVEGIVSVQKLTNEGREYPERCIQVKRGKRNRPHKKERWNGRAVYKEKQRRGKGERQG